MGALFGLLTSLSIGGADFFGRPAVRASSAITVGVWLQLIGIASAGASALLLGDELVAADVTIGLVAGLGMAVGLSSYLEGIDRSSATIVSPIAATLSAIIPFGFTLLRGDSRSMLAVVGATVALLGLVIVTAAAPGERTRRSATAVGIRWGLTSGLGYGFALTVLFAVSDASGAWPAAAQRVSALAVLAAIATRLGVARTPPAGYRLRTLWAGLLTGLSGVLYLLGASFDPGATAVTAAMYPAISVAVGRAFFGDPARPAQLAGVGLAIAGVSLIVTG